MRTWHQSFAYPDERLSTDKLAWDLHRPINRITRGTDYQSAMLR